MAAKVVQDHHVAWAERGGQNLLDIGQEGLAVDRPVEETGRIDAVMAKRGDEGHGLPAAERGLGLHPIAARSPSAQRRHVGLGPGFVDEHQALGIDAPLILAPLLTSPGDVGTILLLGEQAFF